MNPDELKRFDVGAAIDTMAKLEREQFIIDQAVRVHEQLLENSSDLERFDFPETTAEIAAKHATRLWIAIQEEIDATWGTSDPQ